MKRFFVAAFCTLMMSGSLLAQDAATNVAPVVPVEDVAVVADAVATPAITPSVMEGTFVINPQAAGCTNCGSVVAPVYTPMTMTSAPMMGAPMMAAPAQGCGCAAPVSNCGCAAPVADCGCAAPVADCCDPCARRVGFLSKTRARFASRRGSRGNCCY